MQLKSGVIPRVLILAIVLAGSAAAQQMIAIDARSAPSAPSGHALRVLEQSLTRHGLAVRRAAKAGAGELLLRFFPGAPGGPESFTIHKSPEKIEVLGADEPGLVYGTFELLGDLEAAGWPAQLAQAVSDTARTPDVKLRSLAMSLFNRDLEREWFYAREFWDSYFELLARSRFNQFTLIFGHQTSYFAPPFPFLVNVPGYERLRTPEFTEEDKRRNLEALRMITDLADEWGIQFVLGIWLEQANGYGPNLVEGLSYNDLFDYCPKALAVLLRECPKIKGVQFRANSESGILEDDQNRFFTAMARSIQSVGRPIWTDFRAKGLRAETIDSFRKLGMHPMVSTKFWREHMGLPFHGTRIDPLDKQRSYRRYGYWDLLPHDRAYNVMYEMWSFGSQKVLLWGGLDYARRFAASTHLGDAEGFEIFAPLSQKGFGNYKGGPWHIFADRAREYYRWEFERYWAYYLSFGLASYAPRDAQPVLEGEFREHFGAAAQQVRQAYETASWIIPFLTAVRNPSSSNFHYWPELETDGLTDRYIQLDTGDNNLFYRIDEYVDDTLARRDSARLTPERMASRLDGWAAKVQQHVSQAEPLLPASINRKEFTATRIDFQVLSALARYHAGRLRSAQNYQFFVRTGERFYLTKAIEHYREALAQWTNIAKVTDGVYYGHMVFNRPPDQIGHWKDELPMLRAEQARLEQIDKTYVDHCETPEAVLSWKISEPVGKMEMKWKEEGGVLKRWADTSLIPDKSQGLPDVYSMQDPRVVIQKLFAGHRYARIFHAPLRTAPAGRPITIHASLASKRDGVALTMFYRVAGRGYSFTPVRMNEVRSNIFQAEIPAATVGDTVDYYLRATAQTAFFDGSAKEPHAIIIGNGRKPVIWHQDLFDAGTGARVRIHATVESVLPLSTVRLYYRHLDQSEDWRIVEMKKGGGMKYEAVIPGEFVDPGWDLSYLIEAVDVSGAGSFYPDFDKRQPFVVIRVR